MYVTKGVRCIATGWEIKENRHPDIRAPQNFNFVGDTRSGSTVFSVSSSPPSGELVTHSRHPDAGREPLCSCTMDTGLRRYDDKE